MDPNATLAHIRELNAQMSTHGELDGEETSLLVELIENLDDWLSKGGFLPEPWNVARG